MARSEATNRTRYWWDRQTAGLSLMHADFTTHKYPPHSHQALVVAVTETGGSVIKSRGTVSEADASVLYVFNPAEPHAGWMGRSCRWRYRSLYLTQSAIDAVAAGLGVERVPYFTSNVVSDRELVAAFLDLHRALDDGGDAFAAQELLIGSFGALFDRHGSGPAGIAPAPRDDALLRAARERMAAGHDRPLHLEELAGDLGLTVFQLIGLFKRTTGLTPHAYLTQLRLSAACRLLRRGTPIAEAATASGFYDQSALNRHFKRNYAMTPRQFAGAAVPRRNFRQYPGPTAA